MLAATGDNGYSPPAIFALARTSPDGAGRVVCLVNVSGDDVELAGLDGGIDLIGGGQIEGEVMALGGYQAVWLG